MIDQSAQRSSEPLNNDAAVLPRLVAGAHLEVIPLKGAWEAIQALPGPGLITVTCSPKFGLERTLDLVDTACKTGHSVVPHLAARMVRDKSELANFVRRVRDLGVVDLYVIGGDASEPVGSYFDAEELLRDLAEIDHGLQRIGVGCYPEGHPGISDEVLLSALQRKQQYADYMVSQLCFDPDALTNWINGIRSAGVTLPLRLGVAGPVRTAKLAELSLRIGVGQSLRYLTKQHGMIGNLMLGRTYSPMGLLESLGTRLTAPELAIQGLHVFTFNQVAETVRWQSEIARR